MSTSYDDVCNFRDSGSCAWNVLYVPVDGADTQTVTIGQDVYELDRADNGVTAGRIAVTAQADDTPAEVTDALIAAINTSGTENVLAIDIGDTEVLVVSADAPGGNAIPSDASIACSEGLAGAGNVWAKATLAGGKARARPPAGVVRVPTATEVTLGNLHIVFPFTPTGVLVQVVVTSSGIPKAWVGAVVITGQRVTLDNSGATDWAATDTVKVLAWE